MALVNLILCMLAPNVSGQQYAIFTDCAGETRDRRCPPIGGYIPDVYAIGARDSQMRVIGEAKVGRDFESERTEPEMRSFLSFLATFEKPTLIFAVPLSSFAAAANMAGRAAKTVPPHVRIVVVSPPTQRIVSKGWQA